MIEDPLSLEQQMIKDVSIKTWGLLNDRLVSDTPGSADEYVLGGITVKLSQDSMSGKDGGGKAYAVTVYRHFFGRDGEQEEDTVWKFAADGSMQKEGVWVKKGSVQRYGDDQARTRDGGFLPAAPHNIADAIILLDLVIDPRTKISDAENLSYINGQTKKLKISSPGRRALQHRQPQ